MKRFIIFLFVLILLGGAGFGIYWFLFRDKTDGGNLTNKEVLFAIQSVLEDQGVDLNTIVENYNKVDFAPASNMMVYAEEANKLEDEFASLLTENQTFEYDNSNFAKFSNAVVEAYKAIYNNVFNNMKFKQNVWYETENGKISVYSDDKENINIYAFLSEDYYEIKIDFNFRNQNNIYSYETKILKQGETQNYEYLYFNRNAENALSFYDVKFVSTEKYLGDEEEISLTFEDIKIFKKLAEGYAGLIELSDEQKTEVLNYTLKTLNTNFKNFENFKDKQAEKLN